MSVSLYTSAALLKAWPSEEKTFLQLHFQTIKYYFSLSAHPSIYIYICVSHIYMYHIYIMIYIYAIYHLLQDLPTGIYFDFHLQFHHIILSRLGHHPMFGWSTRRNMALKSVRLEFFVLVVRPWTTYFLCFLRKTKTKTHWIVVNIRQEATEMHSIVPNTRKVLKTCSFYWLSSFLVPLPSRQWPFWK